MCLRDDNFSSVKKLLRQETEANKILLTNYVTAKSVLSNHLIVNQNFARFHKINIPPQIRHKNIFSIFNDIDSLLSKIYTFD